MLNKKINKIKGLLYKCKCSSILSDNSMHEKLPGSEYWYCDKCNNFVNFDHTTYNMALLKVLEILNEA